METSIIQADRCWLNFADPVDVVEGHTPADIYPALEAIEAGVARGLGAAGFIAYEAAPGLDPAAQAHPPGNEPLLRFTLYRSWATMDHCPLPAGAEPPALSARWEPSITPEAYEAGIARIKDWIARGETYQVNYTFALRSAFSGDPAALFLRWHRAQRPRYGAFLQWKDHAVCSVSPELFFALDGDVLTCRPMKGTTPRGLTWTDDEARAVQLQHSLKNRAENIMIVDMMRNDLGRIARPGSVIAGPLFQIERYPTLLQMTSTVRARTGAGFPAIMRALFPSSSITGAPKIRTMELIRRLEPEPRNLYTGTIGALLPSHPFKANAQRWAQFNVAIRTVLIDTARKRAHYGTGGGIVWDSNTTDEFEECRTKALVLTTPPVQCALLETILWKPGSGGFLLNDHIERLAASARYFDFPFSRQRFLTAWHNATHSLPHARHRVRMTLDESGTFQVECTRLPQGRGVMRVAWDDQPVSSQDRMLYHKTTCRDRYRPACARHPEADDVLLWNERGEVTEFTMANLLIQRDGVWFTPPVSSGLLDGVLRRTLIRRGRVREEVILRSELETAQQILWINSLRGFRRIQMVAYSAPQEPSATNQRGGV